MESYNPKTLDTKSKMPFGAQYLTEPKTNNPGPIKNWSWKPKKEGLELNIEKNASWPATTGTGPTMREDERYMESG